MKNKDKRSYAIPEELQEKLENPFQKKRERKPFILKSKLKKQNTMQRPNDKKDDVHPFDSESESIRDFVDLINGVLDRSKDISVIDDLCSDKVIEVISNELTMNTVLSSFIMKIRTEDREQGEKAIFVRLFQTLDLGNSIVRKKKQEARSVNLQLRLQKFEMTWKCQRIKIIAQKNLEF